MEEHFYFFRNTRENIKKALNGLTMEQINMVPENFNNNIAWNFAHIKVTQQLLCYKLSGLQPHISDDLIERFRKGTAPDPSQPMTENEFESLKEQLFELIDQTVTDYNNGLFVQYHSYTTSFNATLNNFRDAVIYNNIHEGLHLGYILALKRVILS